MQAATVPHRKAAMPEPALDRQSLILAAVLFLSLFIVYAPTLLWTARVIMSSDDMAHGMCAPIVAAYIFAQKREFAFRHLPAPNWWGLLALALSALVAAAGSIGGSTTIQRLAFLLSLSSCIAITGGTSALVRLKFPILLLLFTFPIPPVLYATLTGPLQSLATSLSQSSLELLGFSTLRDGNLLELPHYRLSIVEACSGIRSLVTLLFFCCLYAYFMKTKFWPRLLIVSLSVPSALLLNVVRITVTGILGEWQPALTHGTYHEALGWICLALGFALVLILDRIIRFAARGFSFAH